MNKWLNTEEAADFLKVTKWTVYRYCREGLLPYYKKKSALRFREKELEEWLEQGARNVLTNLVPVDIEMLKGGNSELAKKKPTCLNYGRVYLRTYRSGKSSWTIDYRDGNGRRIQRAIPFAQSRKEAIFFLQKKIIEVFNARHNGRRSEKIGFSDFSEIYLQDYAIITKKSWRTDAGRLRIMDEFFKDIELREISPLMIQKFRASRLREGNSKSTCNRYLALLKRMYNVAVGEGYAEDNPVKQVKLFSEKDNLRERILTDREERRLMENCSETLKPIITLALNTGMRKGEILNLTWNQIDLRKRLIRVVKTKSGRSRTVPINDTLFQFFLRKTGSEYVFSNPKTGKPYVDMKTGFKGACRRAGISNLRFHDLRHTFASRLIEKGADIETIRELLGHSSITITQRYTHSTDDRKRAAVELLSREEAVTQIVTQDTQSKLIH